MVIAQLSPLRPLLTRVRKGDYSARMQFTATVSNVKYEIKSTSGGTKNAIACALSAVNKLNVAARKNDVDGACEAIDWDSVTAAEQESGFTFMKKKKTVEIYNPPMQVFERTAWLLPGYFGAGSQLEFYFTMPTSGMWTEFRFDIVDSTETLFNEYNGPSEIIMAHIYVIKNENVLWVKGFNGGWTDFAELSPMPFSQGGIYKMTFRPSNVMKVYVDDNEVASYSHLTPPGSARQLSFTPKNSFSSLQINNITFVGV